MRTSSSLRRAVARLPWVAAVSFGLAVLFGVPYCLDARKDAELRALPEPARIELYRRTVATLTTTCEQAVGRDLTEFCHEQADLLVHFPDCDQACRELRNALDAQADAVRAEEAIAMTLFHAAGLIVAGGLFAYLLFALLKPESMQ